MLLAAALGLCGCADEPPTEPTDEGNNASSDNNGEDILRPPDAVEGDGPLTGDSCAQAQAIYDHACSSGTSFTACVCQSSPDGSLAWSCINYTEACLNEVGRAGRPCQGQGDVAPYACPDGPEIPWCACEPNPLAPSEVFWTCAADPRAMCP
jgi:hypothetical protein